MLEKLNDKYVFFDVDGTLSEYLYNDHVRDYAPDIAKSAIVFGENNTFELSFVYMDAAGADEPYAGGVGGIFTECPPVAGLVEPEIIVCVCKSVE